MDFVVNLLSVNLNRRNNALNQQKEIIKIPFGGLAFLKILSLKNFCIYGMVSPSEPYFKETYKVINLISHCGQDSQRKSHINEQ